MGNKRRVAIKREGERMFAPDCDPCFTYGSKVLTGDYDRRCFMEGWRKAEAAWSAEQTFAAPTSLAGGQTKLGIVLWVDRETFREEANKPEEPAVDVAELQDRLSRIRQAFYESENACTPAQRQGDLDLLFEVLREDMEVHP